MPSTVVSFQSICEVRSLGHDQVGTRGLTHHCRSWSARTAPHARGPRQRSIRLPRWHSHSARDPPLSSSQRAKPRTWCNPFGRGLSPCRRITSYSTCLTFLPSACPRVQSDVPAPFWILWVVCQCRLIVSSSVSELCASYCCTSRSHSSKA